MISRSTYIFLYILLAVAIGYGLFLPLLENDSAQHATMAMQMAQSNDYMTILKGGNDYLDKPHMHFWLSALSFEIFGYEVWAYRLPAIILMLFGGYATYKLANLFQSNKNVGRLSALFFLTAQAIILSMHDVRTDAVLTSFTILAMWQWTRFLKSNIVWGAILGGIFTAAAYSTKGLIAIAVIGAFLFFVVLYKNYWHRLLRVNLFIGILCFLIASIPMLNAYYHQFGIEGIEFITYSQVTGRFSGEDFGGASKNDYAFYFHTVLWAFLPWSLWFYYGIFYRIKNFKNYKDIISKAAISVVLLFIVVMNFSEFKLPHYLNIAIPLMAIFTAQIALDSFTKAQSNIPKNLQITQYVIAIIGLMILGLLGVVAFPVEEIPIIITLLIALTIIIILFIQSRSRLERTIVVSAGFILFANVYLNSTFYPQLLEYQSGTQLGKIAAQQKVSPKNIYMVDGQYSWAMDWYIKGTTQKITREELSELQTPHWVMMRDIHPNDLLQYNFEIEKAYKADDYKITRLNWDFINPLSRPLKLKDAWLVLYVPK